MHENRSDIMDILIVNTNIIDGTGNLAFKANIGILQDKIHYVGNATPDAKLVINGEGLYTSPGFIDPHSHIDISISLIPSCDNYLMQGITTAIGNNCGLSNAPTKDLSYETFMEKVEQKGLAINMVPLIGHNPIRELAMKGDFKRYATQREIEAMKENIHKLMQWGAFGFSTGLDSFSGEYASTAEIIELAKVVAKYEGIYTTHHRHHQSQWATSDLEEFGYGVFHNGKIEDAFVGRYEGFNEALKIAREAKIRLEISHLVNIFRIPQPHTNELDESLAQATLTQIDAAISQGTDVSFDVMISTRSINGSLPIINEFLYSRIPQLKWIKGLSKNDFLLRLKDPEFHKKLLDIYHGPGMKFSTLHTKADPYWMQKFQILQAKNPNYIHKFIENIAHEKKVDSFELILDLILDDPEIIWIQFYDERTPYPSLVTFLKHSRCMPCTDSPVMPPVELPMETMTKMFPTENAYLSNVNIYYSTFADLIGSYVRDHAVFRLEEIVHKATQLPAQRFQIPNRGLIKPGYFADLVVFDYSQIKPSGDLLNARKKPEGIIKVFVNGQIAYTDKTVTSVRAGRILKKSPQTH